MGMVWKTRRNVFSMVSDGGKIAIRGTRSNDAVLNENVLMKVVSVVVPDGVIQIKVKNQFS